MAKRKKKIKSGDFILFILTLCLVIFGVIMVFSSSYYYAINEYQDAYHYLKRDIVWAASGILIMAFLATIDYRIFNNKLMAKIILIASIVMLLLIFTPLGVTRNFATRWIGIGGFTIMPGEIAKIAAILFVSWFLSSDIGRIKSFKSGVLPLFLLCGVYGGLIMKQPNMSTAITVCAIIIGIMFVAGLNWFYLFGIVGSGAAAVCALIFLDEDGYRLKRFVSFLNPFEDPLDTGYQVVQSLLALGSGGLFGVGLGKSIQKNLYLPEPQNDFILAIIGEEVGYIGIIILLICYIYLIWRGMHIALHAADFFGTLVASGITIMLAVQVVLNVAVVTSSMPPTGVTLPFISYGGNALWLFMAAMGLLLSISRRSPS